MPGLRDPLWRLIQGAIVAAAALALVLGWTNASPAVGAGACATTLAAGWLATRAL